MEAKRYVDLFLKVVVFFSLFHLIIWNLYTKHIFDNKDNEYIGDAGRISYQVNSLHLKKDINSLEKRHLNFNINEKNVDVLTIGDSFSNGIVRGKNPFYQDYISNMYSLKVMNIQNPTDNFINVIIKLSKLGILKKLNVKDIIIQTVERNAYSLSKDINFDIDVNDNYLKNITRNTFKRDFNHTIINRLNYNALLYNILYNFDSRAYKSKIYKLKLTQDFFSIEDKNVLLCYKDDVDNIVKNNLKAVKKINKNLNKLQRLLNKDNIKLHFMPAVDKYNLYSKYILKNKLQKSNFFENLRSLKKEYSLVDTKKILRKELKSGKKDIYYADDTHWSYKASKIIVEELNLKANFYENTN